MATDQTGLADQPVMTWRWSPRPQCVGLARAQLRKALASWGLAGIEEPAVLVISELVTNAMRHAHTPHGQQIQTRFVQENGGVRLEVYDSADAWPVPRLPNDSGGFGLQLVDQLASQWGVEERLTGKCVWAVVSPSDKSNGDTQ